MGGVEKKPQVQKGKIKCEKKNKLGECGGEICLGNEEEGEFVSPRWEGNKELSNDQELGFVRL